MATAAILKTFKLLNRSAMVQPIAAKFGIKMHIDFVNSISR